MFSDYSHWALKELVQLRHEEKKQLRINYTISISAESSETDRTDDKCIRTIIDQLSISPMTAI